MPHVVLCGILEHKHCKSCRLLQACQQVVGRRQAPARLISTQGAAPARAPAARAAAALMLLLLLLHPPAAPQLLLVVPGCSLWCSLLGDLAKVGSSASCSCTCTWTRPNSPFPSLHRPQKFLHIDILPSERFFMFHIFSSTCTWTKQHDCQAESFDNLRSLFPIVLYLF